MTRPEKIGAFFDVDGTLLGPPSLEWRFIAFLLARDELATHHIARWLVRFGQTLVSDPRDATLGNKHYLGGLRTSLVSDWEQSLTSYPLRWYGDAIERMRWHGTRGHRVFLVSGTLDCLANVMRPQLPGPVEVSATQLEVLSGHWTGRIVGVHLSGSEKGRVVRSLAAQFSVSLWDSYAYGNSIRDLPMLDAVGQPTAVNPRGRLRRIAFEEGWPICDWRLAAEQRVSRLELAAREAR
jgi:HAD superfamily hydrolase (TIGR01490 family)